MAEAEGRVEDQVEEENVQGLGIQGVEVERVETADSAPKSLLTLVYEGRTSIEHVASPKSPSDPVRPELAHRVSRTRMSHLPPKPAPEENAHHQAWLKLMADSAAKTRQNAILKEKELMAAREADYHSNKEAWQAYVLPNIKQALVDPNRAQLWWTGIPSPLRGQVWAASVSNMLAMGSEIMDVEVTLSEDIMQLIEQDIQQTLPTLGLFQSHSPLYDDLKNVMTRFVYTRGSKRYPCGSSRVGALLLMQMPTNKALLTLCNLAERPMVSAFWSRKGCTTWARVFNAMLSNQLPKVFATFVKVFSGPMDYLHIFIDTLFVGLLPLDAVLRFFDVWCHAGDDVLGDAMLIRGCLAVLACLEARLLEGDRDQLLRVLSGQDGAATRAWERECEAAGRPAVKQALYDIYNARRIEVDFLAHLQAMEIKSKDIKKLLDREG